MKKIEYQISFSPKYPLHNTSSLKKGISSINLHLVKICVKA